MLADEHLYIAHKIADPAAYPPPEATFERYPSQREEYQRAVDEAGKPPKAEDGRAKVHVAIFDDCCHVATTLSITKPAKYMYRSVASFHTWALERARTAIGNDDEGAPIVDEAAQSGSTINSSTTTNSPLNELKDKVVPSAILSTTATPKSAARVTVTGKEGPWDARGMIRERVSFDGYVRPMEPVEQIDALAKMDREKIGQITDGGPIKTWLAKRAKWDKRYAKELAKAHERKANDSRAVQERGVGYLFWQKEASDDWKRDRVNERPPACSVAACGDAELAREMARSVDAGGKKKGTNAALVVWSKISAFPDEEVVTQAQKDDKDDKQEHDDES